MHDTAAILAFLSLLVSGVIANLFARLSRLEKRVDGLQTSLSIWKTAYAMLRAEVGAFVTLCRVVPPTPMQLDSLNSAKTIVQLEADVMDATHTR